MSASEDEEQKKLHRQSIGNAAMLFGGGDDDQSSLFEVAPTSADAGDDFFSGSGATSNSTVAKPQQADDPSGQTQHTPTQSTVALPKTDSISSGTAPSTDHSEPSAPSAAADSLFGDSSTANDDWLGLSQHSETTNVSHQDANAAAAALPSSTDVYGAQGSWDQYQGDQYQQQYSYDQQQNYSQGQQQYSQDQTQYYSQDQQQYSHDQTQYYSQDQQQYSQDQAQYYSQDQQQYSQDPAQYYSNDQQQPQQYDYYGQDQQQQPGYYGHDGHVYDPYAPAATQSSTSMDRDATQTGTEQGFGMNADQNMYASPPGSEQKLSSSANEAYDPYGPPPPRNASAESNDIAAATEAASGYDSEAAEAETPIQYGYDSQYPSQSSYDAYAPQSTESREDSGGSYDPYGPSQDADSAPSMDRDATQTGTEQGFGMNADQNIYASPPASEQKLSSSSNEAYDPYGPPPPRNASTGSNNIAAATKSALGYESEAVDAEASTEYGYDSQYPSQSSYDAYAPQSTETREDSGGSYDPYGPSEHADSAQTETGSYDPYGPPKRAGSTQNQAGWSSGADDANEGSTERGIYEADGQQQQSADMHFKPQNQQQDDFGRRKSETYDPYGPPLTPSRTDPGYGPSTGGPVSRSFSQDLLSTSSSTMLLPDVAEERRRVRIPCVTFGVDGKVVTYFPQSAIALGTDSIAPSYGGAGMFDSAASLSDFPTKVTVRSLHSLVSSNSYASVFDPLKFPGPVFEGAAGSGGLGALGGATLSRAGASGTAKKAAVVAFLRDRAAEVEQGLQYLSLNAGAAGALGGERDASKGGAATTVEGQRSADKAILLRLLALIVEHDGKVVDNLKFDAAARSLLADRSEDLATPSASAYSSSTPLSPTQEEPVATYSLTPSFLSNLQTKLVQGQRHEAVQYALEQRMWAHAMVIASGLDKETWCKTVAEFISFELEREAESSSQDIKALRTAYNLFSGQNATRVYDSFRPKVSLNSGSVLPGSNPATGWQDSAAAVISNRSAADNGVLTAMGDGLLLSESIEAAHVCYLLSPQAANFGGVDTPGVRAVLVGGHNPRASNLYLRDLDSILLTEIYEYAQSLIPTVKGQELFNGLPHLQAFRLVHAMTLAELGETARAQKYCEAIAATFKSGKPSPYFHPILLSQLKEFTTRLMGGAGGAGASAASGNWMTKKMQKPTLDGVWGALEGRFTKFIAGEDGAQGSAQSSQPVSKAGSTQGIVGPFSHFSSITADGAEPTMSSQPTSRAGSAMDFRPLRAESPAVRATSALSVRGGMQPLTPFGGVAQQPNTPNAARDPYSNWPGSATQSSFATNALSPYGNFVSEADETSGNGQTALRGVNPQMTGSFASSQSSDAGYEGPYRSHGETSDAPWWGQESMSSNATAGAAGTNDADTSTRTQAPGEEPYYGYQPHGAAAPQFFSSVDPPAGDAADSFVSPMDAFSRPASREPSYGAPAPVPTSRYDDVDEEDDLGLGNSANKKPKAKGDDDKAGANAPAAAAAPSPAKDESKLKPEADQAKKPELRTVSSTSSWLGRLWGRGGGESESKSKQAHLGAKENTFYYDKELKRWVNKAAGDTGAAATPPPPPPQRAQTASPSVQNGRLGAPPPRSSLDHTMTSSSSSAYLRTSATPEAIAEEDTPVSPTRSNFGAPARARSNLSDLSVPPAAQPPMRPASAITSGLGGPPPMGNSAPPSTMGSPSLGSTPPPPGGPPRAGGAAKKKPLKARYVVVD
ncbi:hypothetical protein OC846_003398 [Tilletia horrida]|uniref:Protein transport protein sec16 n=1 Tax=Tilletia horrida TaxID=155126 RepID=A0AAN6GP59_9BASI|nr:hypothetical protein OC845_003223 [Tilletia horrida]KAK0551158.1 hypothetical protein OC846_003398 [Tilletia horrida]KAK0566109.1 hypothetical protein OC861_003403 [Tilletia horrida]